VTGLTVVSIVRNGVRNGYPFVEAFASWFAYCDRVYVLEGESDDGTQAVLAELAALNDRFEFSSRPWPASGVAGTSIAEFTDAALSAARAYGSDRLMYVQADEIYTPEQRHLVSGWRDGALEFEDCINFWNSLETVVVGEFPMKYVRLFPAETQARALGDGFSFDLGETSVKRLDERILHYGWCFPVNILEKHISHGRLYDTDPAYVLRGRLALRLLERRKLDRALLDALLPAYRPTPYRGEHPLCMRHLLGRSVYDPYVGLDLLRDGAVW
jgi:hypothetical protein